MRSHGPCSQQAFELARPAGASVRVVIDRPDLGHEPRVPEPGPEPVQEEWDERRLIARRAVEALEKAGFEASAQVIGTRKAAKRILGEASGSARTRS